MRKYSVYIHTNKVNGKRYIGVTEKKPEERWVNGRGYKNNPYFTAAIKKYGWENFDHFILEVDSRELMFQLEQQYIAYYKTTDKRYGYNISSGGDSGHYLGKNSGSKEYRKYYVDKWKKEHKEEYLEYRRNYDKDYYQKNREKVSERKRIEKKKWYDENKEDINKRRKEYRDSNKDIIREQKRRYYEKYKEKIKARVKSNYYKSKESKDIQPITPLW